MAVVVRVVVGVVMDVVVNLLWYVSMDVVAIEMDLLLVVIELQYTLKFFSPLVMEVVMSVFYMYNW